MLKGSTTPRRPNQSQRKQYSLSSKSTDEIRSEDEPLVDLELWDEWMDCYIISLFSLFLCFISFSFSVL